MPFKSKAQQRFMFAAEDRGDVPKGTAEEWAKATPNISSLPDKVSESEDKPKKKFNFAPKPKKKAGYAASERLA